MLLSKDKIKIYILRTILFIGIVLWMLVIFGFSAADATESQSLSDKITKIVVDFFVEDYYSLSEALQTKIWNEYSFIVRKIGHFGEYAILGILLTGFLLTFRKVVENKKLLLIGLFIGILYSISDEVHQGFVDGRSPKILDVFIDTLGVLFGIVFIRLVICFVRNTLKNETLK